MRKLLIVTNPKEWHVLGNGEVIHPRSVITTGPQGLEAEVITLGEHALRVKYLKTGRNKTISYTCLSGKIR